jgi:hypothetical protein
MGPCKHCGENHLHSTCRRKKKPSVVIPVGYCCPTAEFLKMMGVRRLATPLDWCRSTQSMWVHVLQDGGHALTDQVHLCHDASDGDKPYHGLYSEPTLGGSYPRVQLWLHGYDRATWMRRCERMRELLHDAPPMADAPSLEDAPPPALAQESRAARVESRTPTLGLHLDFENEHEELASATSAGSRLDRFTAEAIALGDAADSLAGACFIVVAVLFVSRHRSSATQVDVLGAHADTDAPAPEAEIPETKIPVASSSPVSRVPLVAIDGADGCFACARPKPNVTVLRYVVPHAIRNGAGNPLPKGQNALLEQDAERLHAVLRSLFPDFFPPPRSTVTRPVTT